ncbi:hypothetical protein P3S67_009109 [Capsicum chacoense]
MRLDKLIYWNDVTLLNFLFGGANGQAPDDHDGGEDERDHDQNGSAIEQNADQDVGVNERDHDQNGDANE